MVVVHRLLMLEEAVRWLYDSMRAHCRQSSFQLRIYFGHVMPPGILIPAQTAGTCHSHKSFTMASAMLTVRACLDATVPSS